MTCNHCLWPSPKSPRLICSPSVSAFLWKLRHIRGCLTLSRGECEWTFKPSGIESASVQAYHRQSRKCNKKMEEETTYQCIFILTLLFIIIIIIQVGFYMRMQSRPFIRYDGDDYFLVPVKQCINLFIPSIRQHRGLIWDWSMKCRLSNENAWLELTEAWCLLSCWAL